jgi:hypothetical protein
VTDATVPAQIGRDKNARVLSGLASFRVGYSKVTAGHRSPVVIALNSRGSSLESVTLANSPHLGVTAQALRVKTEGLELPRGAPLCLWGTREHHN